MQDEDPMDPRTWRVWKWRWTRDWADCAPSWMFWDSTSGAWGGLIGAILFVVIIAGAAAWAHLS